MKNKARMGFIVKLAIIFVIIFCLVSIFNLRTGYNDLKNQEQQLLLEKEKYEENINRLLSEINHPMNEEYVRRIAREKLNYYLPDEIVFYSDR